MSVLIFEMCMAYKNYPVHFDQCFLLYINTDLAVFTATEDPISN